MSPAFSAFVAMLEQASGIALDQTKLYLIESRLAPLARQHGSPSVESFVATLNRQPPGALHRIAFEALTTNETSFFRDAHCFERLARVVLPELIRKRGAERSLNIWSAAAATGQEAYSLAMLLRERLPDIDRWNIRIIASDYSERALEKAEAAHYAQHEVARGLDATRLARHFVETGRGFTLRPEIRSLVRFERLNLIETWPSRPLFDLVLLRNVLIYFSPQTREQILARVHRTLHPTDGILLLGATEMIAPGDRFALTQLDRLSLYRPIAEQA